MTRSGPPARGGGWWDDAFGRAYLLVYAHRDDAAAEREVGFAVRALRILPGDRVLDAGCGAGRHVRVLRAARAEVVGLDRSGDLLAEARRRGAPGCLVRGDLRALPFADGTFAHVVSFFTSFGYFDEDGDRRQLGEFRRVLAAGGGALLDLPNAPRVAATLVPESERSEGPWMVRERRRIVRGRVEKDVDVRESGRPVAAWHESVRLRSRDEVRAVLGAAGFDVAGEYGGLAGETWSAASERLVVRAVRR